MAVIRLFLVTVLALVYTTPQCEAFLKAAVGLRIGLSPTEKGYGQPLSAHYKTGPAFKGQFLTGVHGEPPHGRSHSPGGHGGGSGILKHLKILGVNLYLGGPRNPQSGHHGSIKPFGSAPKPIMIYNGGHRGGFSGPGGFGPGFSHAPPGHGPNGPGPQNSPPQGPPLNNGGIDYSQNEVDSGDNQNNGQGFASNSVGKVFRGPTQMREVFLPAASQYPNYSNEIQSEIKKLNEQVGHNSNQLNHQPALQNGGGPQQNHPGGPPPHHGPPHPYHGGPPPHHPAGPPPHYLGGPQHHPGGPPHNKPPRSRGISLASLMRGPQWSSKPRFSFSPFGRGPPSPRHGGPSVPSGLGPHHGPPGPHPMHHGPPPRQNGGPPQQGPSMQQGHVMSFNPPPSPLSQSPSQSAPAPTLLREQNSPAPSYSTLYNGGPSNQNQQQSQSSSTNYNRGPIQNNQLQNFPVHQQQNFNQGHPNQIQNQAQQGSSLYGKGMQIKQFPVNSPRPEQRGPEPKATNLGFPKPPLGTSSGYFNSMNFPGPPAFSPMPSSQENSYHQTRNPGFSSPFGGPNSQKSNNFGGSQAQSSPFASSSSSPLNPFASDRQREFGSQSKQSSSVEEKEYPLPLPESESSYFPQPGNYKNQGGYSSSPIGSQDSYFPQGERNYSPQGGSDSYSGGPDGYPTEGESSGPGPVEYSEGRESQNGFNGGKMPFNTDDGFQYSHTISGPVMSMGVTTYDDPPQMMDRNPFSGENGDSSSKNGKYKRNSIHSGSKTSKDVKSNNAITSNNDNNNSKPQVASQSQIVQTQTSAPKVTISKPTVIKQYSTLPDSLTVPNTMMSAASTNNKLHLQNMIKKWKPLPISSPATASTTLKNNNIKKESQMLASSSEISLTSVSSAERSNVIRRKVVPNKTLPSSTSTVSSRSGVTTVKTPATSTFATNKKHNNLSSFSFNKLSAAKKSTSSERV